MHLPSEWHPQQLVLFSFPNRDGDWGDGLDAASKAMIKAANQVHAVTPVLMVVGDAEHFAAYSTDFQGTSIELPTNDVWIRDYGPIIVFDKQQKPVFLDFEFNGWGGKFDAKLDDQVAKLLHEAKFAEVPYKRANFILEGGAIESDGQGSLMTTTTCLFSQGRNGWDDPEKVDPILSEYFGKKTDIFWLTDGELIGDDTDGHVDTLARFLDERTIAYTSCIDRKDPQSPGLKEMWEDLKYIATPHNKPYKLLGLPLPPAIHGADGKQLPATYANFFISNGTVFVPSYFEGEADDHPGKAADAAAVAVFEKHGKYKIVQVDCRPFIEQHGSLHCLTMQVPVFS
ncbi:MAG: agmatine deiminase [Neolewinella sp.]|jgi:agmatine deiminase